MRALLIFILAGVTASAWGQTDTGTSPIPPSGSTSAQAQPLPPNDVPAQPALDQPMVPPTVVSGAGSSLAFTPEMERSNYLRGGAFASAAYEDNVLSSVGNEGSDLAYTIGPFVSLDLTRTRARLDFKYSPGFTFYQRHSVLDQASHSLGLNFAYRLSPHVTFTAQDTFVKSSGVFGPLDYSVNALPNPLQSQNLSLIAPVQDTLINTATVGLSYQFGRNDMVGVTGNSSILRYLNTNQSSGLFDSTSFGGGGYYTHRFANRNYFGVNYQFQNFRTDTLQLTTRANTIYGFYTLYLKPTFSVTVFGGPQYSDTFGGGLVPQHMWAPAGGASISWQGKETSFAASYSRRITDGGGLQGAVRANIADASFRAQLTKTLVASIGADYTDNAVLVPLLPESSAALNGHSLSETASVSRTFGEHLSGSIAYSHLHESYSNIPLIALAPNQNRVSITVFYQFERPLGR